jgi:hypothetical protein
MMEFTDVKAAIITRLARYQAFQSEAALSRLYEAIIISAGRIRRQGEWDWKNSTESLATTAGNLGPYDPPTSLYRLALEKRIYRYGYSDTAGVVLAPIRRTDTEFYDLIYRVEDGKLYFRDDPGTGTHMINYLAELPSTPSEANAALVVEIMPGNLYDILANFVEAEFLNESPDTAAEASNKLQIADIDLKREWREYSKGRHRQRQRSPRGQNGLPVLDGIGQGFPLRGRRAGIYPRRGG